MTTYCLFEDREPIAADISIFSAPKSCQTTCVTSRLRTRALVPATHCSKKTGPARNRRLLINPCSSRAGNNACPCAGTLEPGHQLRSRCRALSVISGGSEAIEIVYQPGSPADFLRYAEASREEEIRAAHDRCRSTS